MGENMIKLSLLCIKLFCKVNSCYQKLKIRELRQCVLRLIILYLIYWFTGYWPFVMGIHRWKVGFSTLRANYAENVSRNSLQQYFHILKNQMNKPWWLAINLLNIKIKANHNCMFQPVIDLDNVTLTSEAALTSCHTLCVWHAFCWVSILLCHQSCCLNIWLQSAWGLQAIQHAYSWWFFIVYEYKTFWNISTSESEKLVAKNKSRVKHNLNLYVQISKILSEITKCKIMMA